MNGQKPFRFKTSFKILFAMATLFFLIGLGSCRKDQSFSKEKFQERSLTLADAKQYYQDHFPEEELDNNFFARQSKTGQRTTREYTLKAPKPKWDAAAIRDLSIGTNAVLAPLYIKDAYVRVSGTKMVPYGFLNYLMMYRDTTGQVITEWVELKPEEKWIFSKTARKYSGDILIKDDKGKLKKMYSYAEGQVVLPNHRLIKKKVNPAQVSARTKGDEDPPCYITTTIDSIADARACPCQGHIY